MERCSFRRERSGSELEEQGEGAFQVGGGPGFCIVSMATLSMSYQIITLSSPMLLLLHLLVALTVVRLPLIHPRFGETAEEALVEKRIQSDGHFLQVSNNLWDPLSTRWSPSRTTSSRVATEHLIHYSGG